MFDKDCICVDSLNEYMKTISDLSSNYDNHKIIYRGQIYNKKYNLIPSIQRINSDGTPTFKKDSEKIFFEKFKSKVIPYLSIMPTNYWEWLFLMQHYRAPTRLLDWSESPLISLFFALDIDEYMIDKDDPPVVWCLDTYKLNEKFGRIENKEEIPNICDSDENIQNNLEYCFKHNAQGNVEYPLAITGPLNSIRISSQKGLFTLFPDKNYKSLESFSDSNSFLDKIIINTDKISEVKEQLFKIGITYSSVFPEIDSVAKDIIIEYKIQNGG